MYLPAQFRQYLLNQSSPASAVTVKNYLSDVNRFISWYESKLGYPFDPSQVSQDLISSFKSESLNRYSASSVDRSISSLRKFFAFLQKSGQISQFPFEAKNDAARENDADPWRLRDFKNYLYVLNASNLTIKNYIIDVKQFKNWIENTASPDNSINSDSRLLLYSLDSRLVNDYKARLLNILRLSPVSVNRKLSSLRKYMNWATQQGLINSNIQVLNNSRLNTNIFIPAPIEQPAADKLINGQSSMINRQWSSFAPIRVVQKSRAGIWILVDTVLVLPLAWTISQISHATWTARGKPVFSSAPNRQSSMVNGQSIQNIPKSFYAPTEISMANFPTHKKALYIARYSRPNWYRKYHSYAFVSYFHLSLLMLAGIGFSYLLFKNISPDRQNAGVLGTIASASPRVLTYQGRITDENGRAINSETNLRMAIYSSQEASGSALLWQEVTPASPNAAGIFNVVLGENAPIPSEIFNQNPSLYLGITVEDTNELFPRQQIPTVDLSENAEKVQGLIPITNTRNTSNVILALNSSGNLTIGGTSSPTFQATGGTFTLSGRTLVLTTTPQSNGNIIISPNGTGIVDIQKAIQNTSNNNSLGQGAVVVDDLLLISGSSGNQAVLNINQGLTGNLITASAGGSTRFNVDIGGNISSAGSFNGMSVIDGTITNASWNGGLIGTNYGGTGLNTSASSGVPFVSNGTWSIDSGSLAPNHGGTGMTSYNSGDLIYANGNTSFARLNIGGSGNCLVSNGTLPTWSACTATIASNSKWSQGFGSIFMNNSTQDFLVGGSSTSSAKFAVINLGGSGQPTATISGNLIVMPTNGSGGNSGFGTSTPDSRVQITGGGLCVGSDADCNIDNNSEGVIYAASTSTTVYDVAENFPTEDTSLAAGEVVSMDPDRGIFVVRNNSSYNPRAIGAISASPGLLLGGFRGGQYKNEKQVAVALSGRINIKASNENGPIKQGDFVTSAQTPGKIMRATRPGPIIGQALEDWNENREDVMIFVKATDFDPYSYITDPSELSIRKTLAEEFEVLMGSEAVDRIGAYSDVAVAKIKAGYLELGRLTVGTASVAVGFIADLSVNSLAIASEELTIAGVNIRDYIYSIVDQRISDNQIAISSPILETDIIKPGKNLTVKLPTNDNSTKLEITNASDSAVATIDAEGNASFAGRLTSNELQTTDASISGTLRASRIIADEIELSEEVLARLDGIEISSSSPTISNNYISNNYYYNSTDSASTVSNLAGANAKEDIASLTLASGTFTKGLISYGPATFYEVSVADRLFVGAQLSIAGRSINVLGADLELQPLRLGGVSIAGGLVEIDSDGNLRVGGNAYFAKNLEVNGKLLAGIIAPIPGRDLIFDFEAQDKEKKVEFRSGSGSAVLSFTSRGDVNASGAGTFNKLNISFIPEAIAVSETEIIATGSAGGAEIKPYQNELTIKNPFVTRDSLIYITPKTSTPNQSVYLLRQIPENPNQNGIEGSFTVGLSKAIEKSVPFNWILIN